MNIVRPAGHHVQEFSSDMVTSQVLFATIIFLICSMMGNIYCSFTINCIPRGVMQELLYYEPLAYPPELEDFS